MLLIHAADDPHARYSAYLAEILRLEGFCDFHQADRTQLDRDLLAAHDLVILPRLTPSGAEVELLLAYVRGGGTLIACLPAPNLAGALGVTPTYAARHGGYLHPDTSQPALAGLCADPVQIITPVVGWHAPAGGEVLARAHAGSSADDEGVPAVVHLHVGAGQALLFAYDLPGTVARLRQGDPEQADLCFAGLDGIVRPSELFVGQLEPEQMLVPQADLHTALLARGVETLAPRPRLWYYPGAEQRGAMIMTSDDDWSTIEQFETLLDGLRRHDAGCTFYVVPQTHLTPAHMDRWEAEGHTFSVHPALPRDYGEKPAVSEPQRLTVADMLRTNVLRHRNDFGRTPRTVRQHAVRWFGYVEAARVEAELGIRMDVNYLSVHPFSLGYMAGSGRPLRFVETDGALIDCFQQPTLWTEEVLIHPGFVFSFKWSVERALQEVDKILARAAREFYTPVTLNSHPVSFATYSSPLIEGCWQGAQEQNMSIVSADNWLAWTEARDGVRIHHAASGFTADGFTVEAAQDVETLTILLPAESVPEAERSVVTSQTLWGQMYTALTLHNMGVGERRWVATR